MFAGDDSWCVQRRRKRKGPAVTPGLFTWVPFPRVTLRMTLAGDDNWS
jgi:hypothetical protein